MMNQTVQWVLPPLPKHPPPEPDEDLASLLMRTAERMGYDTPSWILRPEAPLPLIDSSTPILWLRKKADYRLLEQLLYLDQAQVYRLTLHRFAAQLQAPTASLANDPHEVQRPLLSHALRTRFFLPRQTTQICPACLAEERPYARVFWHCHYVTFCPHHQTFLIRHCPACQAPIPALRQTLTRCPVCRYGDYRMAQPTPRAGHAFLLAGQAMLLERLGCGAGPMMAGPHDTAPTPLQHLQPWHYFKLLDSFRSLLTPLLFQHPLLESGPTWSNEGQPRPFAVSQRSSSERAWLIATFHELFIDWPDRFIAGLEAFRLREQTTRAAPGITRDFGAFYRQHILEYLNEPALAFVGEAFAEYLSKQYTGGPVHRHLVVFQRLGAELLQDRPYLTLVQASRLLGVNFSALQTLIEAEELPVLHRPKRSEGTVTPMLIEKASIEALRQAWGPLVPLDQVATSFLGVESGTMAGLAREQILLPARGPRVDGYPIVLYWSEHIKQLIAALLEHALPAPNAAPEGVPLAHVYRYSTIWKSLAEVVQAVLKGRLTPMDTQANLPVLRRLIALR